ncbi:MAG: 16S rRNA (guanine(527)-N(7))-methyltransferase RsmG [Chitinophagales bacterium]|nr:16S rRNA (guanine(527)-N(7))-methyltransferase RsmG [Chitinophagales bacterium]
MAGADLVFHYFPELTSNQQAQFAQLQAIYSEWNEKINVISRKDIENLYERHVLHSLAIAKVIQFKPGKDVLDIGTGGGFPGIPLAILFPDTHFHLVDSINKKITVVKAVAEALGLSNVTASHARVETLTEQRYDFAVTRAVAPLDTLYQWTYGKLKRHSKHPLNNGLLALKGGNIEEEIKAHKNRVQLFPINSFFPVEYFQEKYVLYLPYV